MIKLHGKLLFQGRRQTNLFFSRERAEGRFPRSGPSSPRYRMISPRYKFTSQKDMMGNKPIFFQGGGL